MAITLLKKPYRPLIFTGQVKSFNVYGKSFYDVQAVYLSGEPYTNQTFFNPFSGVPKLSATYPGFFGVKLLSSNYSSNNDNAITFTVPSASNPGYVDIIVQNLAGYGTLTQYVIKDLYSGTQTQLQLRPWSLGIEVLSGVKIIIPPVPPLPENQILTIDDNILITIAGDNIVTI